MPKSKFSNIHTGDSNYCLDVYSGSKKKNIPLISYKCHNGDNQKFFYNKKTRQLKIKSSKKCLDMTGQFVAQKKCSTRKKSQKWTYKNKQFKSVKNRKCMDVTGAKYDGGYIITYPCHKGDNQKFQK